MRGLCEDTHLDVVGSRLSPMGAKLGAGLALFPLLPTAGWEKVPGGRMRARAKRGSCRLHHRRAFSAPALIRRFAPPSPAQERGRRGNLRRKLALMGFRRDDGFE